MIEAVGPTTAAARDEEDVRRAVARLDRLLGELDTLPIAPARDRAIETVEALVDLYGEGLTRIVDILARSGPPEATQALVADPLLAHLLLVHDLHPVDLEGRIALAIEQARAHLDGAQGRLVRVEGAVAFVEVEGGSGCGSGPEQLLEDAIFELAPELESVRVERVAAGPQPVTLRATRRPAAAGEQRGGR